MPECEPSLIVLHAGTLREVGEESAVSRESAGRGTIAVYDNAPGPGGALNLKWGVPH